MVLVDTSVWIDHLHRGDTELINLLNDNRVLMHPFILGELACGNLSQRSEVLALLGDLQQASVATDEEVMFFIEHHQLMGKGMGYIDMHLLASVSLTDGSRLWTRDKRLHKIAKTHSLV